MRRKKKVKLNQYADADFPPGSLARQIRLARKALREWPQWMKDCAYFVGTNAPTNHVEDNP